MTKELRAAFGIGAVLVALAAGRAEAASFDLWAQAGSKTFPGMSAPVTIWAYSLGDATTAPAAPTAPGGPVLVVNQGESVTVTLHNGLAEPTALLFKGIDMVPDLTGAAPGSTKSYTFTASAPGAFLYEAGLLANAQHQVAMGLHGALVVRPAASATQAYGDVATAFDDEAVLVLSEIDPALNNRAGGPAGFDMRSYAPKYWLINGQVYPNTAPIASAAGNKLLLRYLNAGNWHHSMALLGMRQTIVGLDGSPLLHSRSAVAETLGPGQTMDAIATVPASAAIGNQFALYDASLLLHNNRAPGLGGMLTFVTAAAGTPGGGAAPTTTGVAVAPSPTNGSVAVTLSASIAASGGASVTAAEYFVDSPAAGGTGTAMTGTFGGATAAVSATISVAQLAALSSGSHVFYVHGQDSNLAWGPLNSATLVLDKAGPLVSALQLSPNPSSGAVAVALSGTASDQASGNANIAAAEYRIDGGVAAPMSIAPAGQPVAALTAAIPSGLATGSHSVELRAQDSLGNWSSWTPDPAGSAPLLLVVDGAGPAVANVASSPPATNGLQGVNSSTAAVRLTATATDASSTIVAAEGFIDTVGAAGAGFPFVPTDGAWNQATENVSADIPLSTATLLSPGNHTLYVRARDAAGNWGATGSTVLLVDKTPPTVSSVTASPNPTFGAFTLSASFADAAPTLGVVAGEWFEGADPGTGRGQPMTLSGSTITASLNIQTLGSGNHTLNVRAKDAAGNWSATGSVVVVNDLIFANGFETGVSPWGWTSATGGNRIQVVTTAPVLEGTRSMQAAFNNTAYVTDNTPAGEAGYHARFRFHPNSATSNLDNGAGNNSGIVIFSGHTGNGGAGTTAFQVRFRRSNAGYQVRALAGAAATGWFTITNAAHAIEIARQSAGTLGLYVDGTLQGSVAAGASVIQSVRLGPSATFNNGGGNLRFDGFVSTRTLVIGP